MARLGKKPAAERSARLGMRVCGINRTNSTRRVSFEFITDKRRPNTEAEGAPRCLEVEAGAADLDAAGVLGGGGGLGLLGHFDLSSEALLPEENLAGNS